MILFATNSQDKKENLAHVSRVISPLPYPLVTPSSEFIQGELDRVFFKDIYCITKLNIKIDVNTLLDDERPTDRNRTARSLLTCIQDISSLG